MLRRLTRKYIFDIVAGRTVLALMIAKKYVVKQSSKDVLAFVLNLVYGR